MAVVRILGIDPGTWIVGYGCLEVDAGGGDRRVGGAALPLAMRGSNVVRVGAASGGDVRLVATGVLRLGSRGVAVPDRLLALAQQFESLLRDLVPDEVALEEAFYGKSAQAALRIGEARGVVLAESARRGLPVHQFAPARVKRAVTGHGASRKQSVASMLGQLMPDGREAFTAALPSDATDALAVAWARLEQRRSPLATLTKPLSSRGPGGSDVSPARRGRADDGTGRCIRGPGPM